jgi:hypothetical protein
LKKASASALKSSQARTAKAHRPPTFKPSKFDL